VLDEPNACEIRDLIVAGETNLDRIEEPANCWG
jgi:hypothetical protein